MSLVRRSTTTSTTLLALALAMLAACNSTGSTSVTTDGGSDLGMDVTLPLDGGELPDNPPVIDTPPVSDTPMACTSSRQCPGQVCDTALGFCVDCLGDADCPAADRCLRGSCVPRPRQCTSSRQCSDIGQVCDTTRMQCVECTGDNDCLTGDRFCDPEGRCAERVCTPGTSRCSTAGTRELCDTRGSRYDDAPCTATQTCRDGACVDHVCVPGSSRCVAGAFGSREICDANGLAYTTAACDTGRSCRDGVCAVQVCVPGSASCVGTGSARLCNADGLGYGKATTCSATSTCDARTGMCADWVCVPGARSCEGNTARLCNADGLGYAPTVCGTTQTCREGLCVEHVCVPGSVSCTSVDARRVCNDDGLGYTPSACAAMNACLGAGTCTPWTCTPRSSTCVTASARRVCTADGQGGDEVPCGTSESCRDGVCRTRICTPGTTRCPSGSAGSFEACDPDGLAWVSSPCAVGRSCSGGACTPWLCTPGTPSCVGSTGTRTCAADGLGYTATTGCATGTSCTPSTGLCGAWVCTPGSATCEGMTRRVCNSDGLGYTSITCTGTQNCTAGVCVDRVCVPGALSCADVNTRRRCNDTGAGYEPAACPAMNACLGAGVCTPWTCTPGASGPCASSTTRQVCNADGQGYSAAACAGATNATGVCTAGACGTTCNSGFGDCDGSAGSGCEANLNTSAAHCGRCGMACTTGQVCTTGTCRSSTTPVNDACSGAVVIPWSVPSTTLTASNVGATTSLTPPCGFNVGTDLFYRLDVPGPSSELVYADTVGSSFDTVLYFARNCTTALTTSTTTGDTICNDDLGSAGCAGGLPSTVTALLTPGTWYLVVAGYNGSSGNVNLRVQHLAVGSGAVALLPAGSTTQSGATSGAGSLAGSCGGGSAGETTWWWRTCPESTGGSFSATTCSRASYDTLIYQRNGDGTAGACSDDFCSLQSSITSSIPAGPGIHALTVDGFNVNTGSFSVAVTRP